MNNNYNGNTINKKSNKMILIIIAIVIVIGIAVFGYFKFIKNSNRKQQMNETENKVDSNTNLKYDKTGAFLMAIEDVYEISGKGIVVTGKIDRGTVKVGDSIQIVGLSKEKVTTTVLGIEMFRNQSESAEIGDNVGILLKDVTKNQVARGQVLAQPNSILESTKFEADIYMLNKDEGGRHTPFFSNYRPQLFFRTIDITGVITLPDKIEMVNPGEKATVTIELISSIAMEKGTEFSIREGGRTIGKGTVTKVY